MAETVLGGEGLNEEEILKELRELGDAVWRGNGKPSIVTRLSVLESQHRLLLVVVTAIAAALIPIAFSAIENVFKGG